MSETARVQSILAWAYYQPDLHLDRCQSGRLTKSYTSKKTGIIKNYAIRLAQKDSADINGTVRDFNGIGRACYIEVKKPGEELRPGQIKFRDKVISLGAIHITAYSIDDVIEGLRPYRRAIQ